MRALEQALVREQVPEQGLAQESVQVLEQVQALVVAWALEGVVVAEVAAGCGSGADLSCSPHGSRLHRCLLSVPVPTLVRG